MPTTASRISEGSRAESSSWMTRTFLRRRVAVLELTLMIGVGYSLTAAHRSTTEVSVTEAVAAHVDGSPVSPPKQGDTCNTIDRGTKTVMCWGLPKDAETGLAFSLIAHPTDATVFYTITNDIDGRRFAGSVSGSAKALSLRPGDEFFVDPHRSTHYKITITLDGLNQFGSLEHGQQKALVLRPNDDIWQTGPQNRSNIATTLAVQTVQP